MASEPVETTQSASGSDAISVSVTGSNATTGKTRQSRVRQKEDAIVSAARENFIANGYGRTTMAMIAREAGVADGTLYTYFENKDALARGVISDFYARLTESARSGVEARKTTQKKLKFLARNHIALVMEEYGIVEMLPLLTSSLADYSGSDIYELNKHYVGVFDGIIREGRARGDIPVNTKVWMLRDTFFGALDHGAKTMLIRSSKTVALKSDLTQLVDQLVGLMLGSGAGTGSGLGSLGGSLADRMDAVADRIEHALKQAGH